MHASPYCVSVQGRGRYALISQGYGFQPLRSEIGYGFKDETDSKEYSYKVNQPYFHIGSL